MLHLYSAFLCTQNALRRRGESPQPPPMSSILLDDAMAAILHQNTLHTPAYGWKGDSYEANQFMGLLGGHVGQRPMGKFGQEVLVLFLEGHHGIF